MIWSWFLVEFVRAGECLYELVCAGGETRLSLLDCTGPLLATGLLQDTATFPSYTSLGFEKVIIVEESREVKFVPGLR